MQWNAATPKIGFCFIEFAKTGRKELAVACGHWIDCGLQYGGKIRFAGLLGENAGSLAIG